MCAYPINQQICASMGSLGTGLARVMPRWPRRLSPIPAFPPRRAWEEARSPQEASPSRHPDGHISVSVPMAGQEAHRVRTGRMSPRRPSPSLHTSAWLPLHVAPTFAASCLCLPSLPGMADHGLWGNSAWQQGRERVWVDGVCLGRAVRTQGCRFGGRAVHTCCWQSGGHGATVGPGWWVSRGGGGWRWAVCRSNSQNMCECAVFHYNGLSLHCHALTSCFQCCFPALCAVAASPVPANPALPGCTPGDVMSVLCPQPAALRAHPMALHSWPWLSLLLSTFPWLVPAHPRLMVFLVGVHGASLAFG